MAIEDFEWEAACDDHAARVDKPSLWARLKQSVWLEPALRLGGMAALLGVLAGIGVVATTYAKPGLPLPEVPRAVAGVLGSSWLKPTPAAPEAAHAHGSAPVAAPGASAAPEAAPGASAAARGASAAAPNSAAPAPSAEAPAGAAPVGKTADGKIILNAASAEELTQLPGVGLKRAQAIVALRTKLKRFKSATELLRVKGIGPKGLQRMLPHLVLDGPAAASS